MGIRLLPAWADAPDAWSELTTGDALFRHLPGAGNDWEIAPDSAWLDGAAPGDKTLPAVARWWRHGYVDALVGQEREETLRRWVVLAQMLWCFDEARRSKSLSPTEIDRVSLGERFPVVDGQGIRRFEGDSRLRSAAVARAYTWIRSFRATEPSVRIDVPVALYDTETRRGFLATLTLELLPGGVGEVADHPGSAFDTIHHDRFVESMERAWTMARGATPDAATADGRWRIRRGAPFGAATSSGLRLVDGPSAGGAAARGWWHALQGKFPDAEIVVLASVSADGRSLDPVDHVAPKVEAIVREGVGPDGHPAFDTIVVVGERARVEAEEALGSSAAHIRVVRLD